MTEDLAYLRHCNSTDEVRQNSEQIRTGVQVKGFEVIRGVFNGDELRGKALNAMKLIRRSEIKGSSGVTKQEIRRNMVKWSIGGNSSTQTGISRFMLTAMNPMYEPDIYGMRSAFKALVEIRDAIAGRSEVMTDERLEGESFNGCRIQLYPKGGGFMSAHRDDRAVENVKESNLKDYIQVVLLLTSPGKDYQSGGAYIIDGGSKINVETSCEAGDVLIYDGKTLHGVEDIDPDKPFDAKELTGRMVAMATIYN